VLGHDENLGEVVAMRTFFSRTKGLGHDVVVTLGGYMHNSEFIRCS